MTRTLSPYKYVSFSLFILLWGGCKKEASLDAKEASLVTIKNFGGSGNDSAVHLRATADGGVLVLANTQSTDGDLVNKNSNDNDAWLLKLNTDLEIEWHQTYGDGLNDSANAMFPTLDGGWMVLGGKQTPASVNQNTDVWLFKINANGQLLWEKTYGFVGIDVGYDGITTPDGGFLLAASLDVTASGGAGNQTAKTKRHAGGDYWLIKTDAEGNTIWSQYYGGLFTDTPCCVVPHPDGGYLIAGTSDSSDFDVSKNLGSYDIWLVRVAANGELLWEKNYGGQQIDSAAAVLSTGDENFILVGTTRSSDQDVIANKGGADIWVLKIDGQGELLWTKNYGGSNFDTAVAAVYNAKNEIIISGNSRSDDGDLNKNQGHNDAWMLVLDSKGNIQNQYTWGGPQTDILNAATQPDKNTFFLLGTTDSPQIGTGNTYGFSDVFISKVSAQ